MTTLLSAWLDLKLRSPSNYKNFDLYDAIQRVELSPEIRGYLIDLVKNSRIDPRLLDAAARVSTATKDAVVEAGLPTIPTAQRGDFGEVLTAAALIEFLDYSVPVSKLRFGINPDQGLPSTDVVAIKKDRNVISEVCFVESKTRTSRDNDCAAEGYKQLATDYSQRLPHMILFILNRLAERNDPLFELFLNYALDRRDTLGVERFHLGLTWEAADWSEVVLRNLEAKVDNANYPRVSVHLLAIKDLAKLIEGLFAQIGIARVIE
jgi:hypothetical protein